MGKWRGIVWCLAVLAAGAWGASAAAQALDLRVDRGVTAEGVADYDFAWVYWWEQYGPAYLREHVADRGLPMDSPATRRFRRDAAAALVPLLNDTEPMVREQALVALARMGHEPVVGLILGEAGETPPTEDAAPEDPFDSPLLIHDPSEGVRCAAWLALGLLDTERASAELARPLALPEPEQASRVAAIGLLTTITDAHLHALAAILTDPDTSPEVKRWVVWAIDRHDAAIDPARRDAIYRWAIENVPSPFVMAQVLRCEGYIARQGGVDRLLQVLRYYPSVRELPGYGAIRALPAGLAHGSSPTRLSMETRIAATLTLAHLPPPERARDRAELRETLYRRAMAGNLSGLLDQDRAPTGLLDFNRGFDVLAFALHSDAGPEDQQALYDLLRGFTAIPPDEARLFDSDGELEPADLIFRQSNNGVRSYTALAIGLLIRRETEGTALYDAWQREPLRGIERDRLARRFGQRLARAIADRDEPNGYRAACALALGLTADPRFIATLNEELARLQSGDELVLGYGLLALAMLGDERAAETVGRYVNRPGPITGTEDLMARRAALQALALLGERAGEAGRDTLFEAWGRSPWLSVEVGRVAGWTGEYVALPKMLTAARSSSAQRKVAAAMALGAALDRRFPAPIEALAEGGNPTMTYRRPPGEQAQPDPPPAVADPLPGENAGLPGSEPPVTDPPAGPPPGQAPALPQSYPPGWPMRELPARGNPFLFERLFRSDA